MQDFLSNLRAKASRFMQGRYGGDQLGITLVSVALVLSLLGPMSSRWLTLVSTALMLVAIWRVLSRAHAARRKENQAFLAAVAKPRAWLRRRKTMWDNRGTKAYVRCPHCHAQFALPKGKGKLRATCPKCGQKSEHTV